MKKFIFLSILFSIAVICSGCGTARNHQNPQPKRHVPCETWVAK